VIVVRRGDTALIQDGQIVRYIFTWRSRSRCFSLRAVIYQRTARSSKRTTTASMNVCGRKQTNEDGYK
jgi:hypothetical protein